MVARHSLHLGGGGVPAVAAAFVSAIAAAHSFLAVSDIMFGRHKTGGVPLANVLATQPDDAVEAQQAVLAGITQAEAMSESTLCMLETLRFVALKWMFRALMFAGVARVLM